MANFKSIKDETRPSLVADPGKERREINAVTPEPNEGVWPVLLLHSAGIYGANAAGKTNKSREAARRGGRTIPAIRGINIVRASMRPRHKAAEDKASGNPPSPSWAKLQ